MCTCPSTTVSIPMSGRKNTIAINIVMIGTAEPRKPLPKTINIIIIFIIYLLGTLLLIVYDLPAP